jgi:hypothetical protein
MVTRTLAVAVLVAASIGVVQTDPAFKVVSRIPDRTEGQQFRTFDTDRTTNRVYLGSDRGLFWLDLAAPDRVKGPMFEKDILKIEIAQDLGRLFYFTKDEVGYVDIRKPGEPVRMRGNIEARAMAYEPTRQEVYVATRDNYLTLFDAKSGEFGIRLPVPGWFGTGLEGAPGRVYAQVEGEQGLYVIDAATHKIAPWPVKGIVTPAHMDADPEGAYLFVAWDRYLAAIDVKTATMIERVVAPYNTSIAYDPGSRLLIASWNNDPPPVKITAYRVESKGLTIVANLENPDIGLTGVEPTNHGFLQRGNTNLLVWAFQGK